MGELAGLAELAGTAQEIPADRRFFFVTLAVVAPAVAGDGRRRDVVEKLALAPGALSRQELLADFGGHLAAAAVAAVPEVWCERAGSETTVD